MKDASKAEMIAMDPENAMNTGSKAIGIRALPSGLRAKVVKDRSNATPNKTPKMELV